MVDAKAGASPGSNLAVIPDPGTYPSSGSYWDYYPADTSGSYCQDGILDTSVLYNGQATIRNPPYVASPYTNPTGDREIDGTWLPVSPGDIIQASVWIEVDNVTPYIDKYSGGRLGMDFYAPNGQGSDITIVDSLPTDGTNGVNTWMGFSNDNGVSTVTFGTVGWTQVSWDVTIPSHDYTKDVFGNTIHSTPITEFVCWLDVPYSKGTVWFADSELCITPTTTPTPTTYVLKVANSMGGTTSLRAGSYTYTAGTVVQVQALPNEGYTFSKWLLDGANQGSGFSINVTMNANHTLQAVFVYSGFKRNG
jgi:hypothetical protein